MHKDTRTRTLDKDNDASIGSGGKKLQILVSHTFQASETTLWRQEAYCQRKVNLRSFGLRDTKHRQGWAECRVKMTD